jgi:cytochrome b subunit of formate dehydrogenase
VEEGRVWLWRATLAFVLVLLVTGIWLAFFYRPSATGDDGVQSVRALRTWFIVHAVGLPIVLAACLAGLWRRSSTVAPTGV